MNKPAKAVIFPTAFPLPSYSRGIVSEHPGAIWISCDIVCSKDEPVQHSSIRGNAEEEGYLILTKVASLTLAVLLTSSQGSRYVCPRNMPRLACGHVEDKRCLLWSQRPISCAVLRLVDMCWLLNVPLVPSGSWWWLWSHVSPVFFLPLWEFIRWHLMYSMSVVSRPGEDAVQFQFCSLSSHHRSLTASIALLLSTPQCLE